MEICQGEKKLTSSSLGQWFSTFVSWQPTKQNKHNLATHRVKKNYRNTGFDDPKVNACDPRVGRDPPPVEKHCSREFQKNNLPVFDKNVQVFPILK